MGQYFDERDFLNPDQILHIAETILGQETQKVDRRGWGTFWCPFHPDRSGEGRGGRPNFGLNTTVGNWNCFRCSASGPSLWKLADELNQNLPDEYFEARERYLDPTGGSSAGLPCGDRRARPSPPSETPPETYLQARDDYVGSRPAPADGDADEASRRPVRRLGEAISWARWALTSMDEAADAEMYLRDRGVSRHTALQYGLGYGLNLHESDVDADTFAAAKEAQLARESRYDDGYWWQWEGSIVYADPPVNPRVIQVRHLIGRRAQELKYQSWGRFLEPLGAWRIEASTDVIVAVEGLFDMLVFAEEIKRREIERMIPVSMGGASPSYESLEWLVRQDAAKVLVPDPDDAGEELVDRYLRLAEEVGKSEPYVARPPDGLDPDEAVLDGWFPL